MLDSMQPFDYITYGMIMVARENCIVHTVPAGASGEGGRQESVGKHRPQRRNRTRAGAREDEGRSLGGWLVGWLND
jgi:hypothetical protein